MTSLVAIRGEGKLVELLGRRGRGRLRFCREPARPTKRETLTEELPAAMVVDLRSAHSRLSVYRVRRSLESRVPVVFVIGNTPGTVRELGNVIQNPHFDFVRMEEESEEPADEIVERVQRLISQREKEEPALSAPGITALRYTAPDLHAPRSGRLDAGRVADLLGIPRAELARLIGKKAGTVAKTPDAPALQTALRVFERIAAPLLNLTGTPERLRAWLNAPNPALGGETPMDLVLEGHVEAVAGLVERVALGEPA